MKRRFVLRRLLLMVPTFIGISLLTFMVARLAPGDPFSLDHESAGVTQAVIEQQREAAELHRQRRVEAGRFISRVVRFDFGRSLLDQRPVIDKLAEALPRTALIAGLALVLGFSLSIPLGVTLAVRRRQRWARVVETLLMVSWSVPSFWLAVVLLLLFASPRFFPIFPVQGLADGGFVLPVVCLMWPTLVVATRQLRTAMSQALTQDYVTAARARGIPETRVVWVHALRNSLLPLVTLAGQRLPHVVGGSAIIERVFGIPGTGLLAFEAVGTRDYPSVMGAATVMAIVTMVSMLLVDLSYVFIDPRIKLEDR